MADTKVPCEFAVWYIIPCIRSALAQVLVAEHGVPQRKVAAILGVTEAAVSQYVHDKRANTEVLSPKVWSRIRDIAAEIAEDGIMMAEKMCELCRLARAESEECCMPGVRQ